MLAMKKILCRLCGRLCVSYEEDTLSAMRKTVC